MGPEIPEPPADLSRGLVPSCDKVKFVDVCTVGGRPEVATAAMMAKNDVTEHRLPQDCHPLICQLHAL